MKEIDKQLILFTVDKLGSLTFKTPSTILWRYKIFIGKYPGNKYSFAFDSILKNST